MAASFREKVLTVLLWILATILAAFLAVMS